MVVVLNGSDVCWLLNFSTNNQTLETNCGENLCPIVRPWVSKHSVPRHTGSFPLLPSLFLIAVTLPGGCSSKNIEPHQRDVKARSRLKPTCRLSRSRPSPYAQTLFLHCIVLLSFPFGFVVENYNGFNRCSQGNIFSLDAGKTHAHSLVLPTRLCFQTGIVPHDCISVCLCVCRNIY